MRVVLHGLVGLLFLLGAGCSPSSSSKEASHSISPGAEKAAYTRIVSMAPSITEVLFAVGAGDAVVGVTRYCLYPPEAKGKRNIGGYVDPNYEAVVALEPDLVVLPYSHQDAYLRLEGLGVHCEKVKQDSLEEIVGSVAQLGGLCGDGDRAAALCGEMREGVARVRALAEGSGKRPRVMVVLSRDYGAAQLEQVFITGEKSIHGELVRLAGGDNVYGDEAIAAPILSAEGVVRLNPEVIIELVPGFAAQGGDVEKAMVAWRALPEVSAVRTGRIYFLTADYVSIPGPRIVQLLEDFYRLIHGVDGKEGV